jgi:hypothetical protein
LPIVARTILSNIFRFTFLSIFSPFIQSFPNFNLQKWIKMSVLWYLSCVLTPIVKYWIRKHCCVSSVCYARSINHLVAPLFLMLTQNTIFRSLHCPTIRRSWVKKETYYLYYFAFLLPKTFLKKHLFSVKLIILFSYSDWSLSANILLDSEATVGMFDWRLFDNSNRTKVVWRPKKLGCSTRIMFDDKTDNCRT